MKSSEYIHLDGVAIADLVERKEVSAKEVLDASFEQLEKVQPELNAVSYTRKEKAYAEIDQAEGPLKGVPTALKDISQTIEGEPSTGGSRLMKDAISPVTSHFTERFLQSGMVSIGNSTTPEFALKNITESKLFGPTRNAWNKA